MSHSAGCSCGGDGCSSPDGVKNRCACCTGIELLTPEKIGNAPGLSRLVWRAGRYGTFKSTLEAGIGRAPALRALLTRDSADWTLGLIDAWAAALEVLAFHQERYGQELYLRTATERRSLLELARQIGYELAPGVAARVALAFTLEEGPGQPLEVRIGAGTRAQSLPQSENELPQTYETTADLRADVRFARLHPRLFAPHPAPKLKDRTFWLAGVTTGLDKGSRLLVVASLSAGGQQLLRVVSVEPDLAGNRTRVRCAAGTEDLAVTEEPLVPAFSTQRQATPPLASGVLQEALAGLTRRAQEAALQWTETLLSRPLADAGEPGLYALTVATRPFGHNAPLFASLPKDQTVFANWDDPAAPWKIGRSAVEPPTTGLYESGSPIRPGTDLGGIHLEQAFPRLLKGSWVVIESPGPSNDEVDYFRALRVREVSVADFGLSGKVTRLELKNPADTDEPVDHGALAHFLRSATLFAGSEKLELAPLPVETLAKGTGDFLLEEVVPRLEPGRLLVAEGEEIGKPGVIVREELRVKEVREVAGRTWLFLDKGLAHGYRVPTLTLYGNVAEATHGESHATFLGSGDAAKAQQRFRLGQAPLTYTADASRPGGAAAALEVRVQGVRWREAPDFYRLGPCDRAYVLRRDEQGHTHVLFGDGRRGARLPTGEENVSALFRVGLGRPGLVDSGRISLLPSPPLGISEVYNPRPSADAADPESRDRARRNAPRTVRTLDRVVSLADYADFAITFAGLDKARADQVWDGRRRVILLSLAGLDGAAPSPALLGSLHQALGGSRDGRPPLRLAAFAGVRFGVAARLRVAADRRFADVAAAAAAALEMAFAFERRELGQSLRSSSVLAMLQAVAGVEAAVLDGLPFLSGEALSDRHGLQASPGRWNGKFLLPAQLLHLGTPAEGALRLSPLA